MSEWFSIEPAGESALMILFEERIDARVNARVIALARAVRACALHGVRDVVPAFRSLAVYFDPLRTDYEALMSQLRSCAGAAIALEPVSQAPIRVPVCYGEDLGPDLAEVATYAGITERDVIGLHTAGLYRVFMLGFMPGFAYMGIVDSRIAAPRRATPRVRVPAGSIGIAGQQTGVYPAATPGGWQLIGRTPLTTFDLRRAEPFLFAPGDTVQFVAIDRADYDRRIAARAQAHS